MILSYGNDTTIDSDYQYQSRKYIVSKPPDINGLYHKWGVGI